MSDSQLLSVIQSALKEFKDPELGRSIVDLDQVSKVDVRDNKLSLTLALASHSAPIWDETRDALVTHLKSRVPSLGDVQVSVVEQDRPAHMIGQIGLTAKSVIAVGSGKGGVGKSTIAASIALGLKLAGAKVGLMDADVYGPSIPHLLGLEGRGEVDENSRKIKPIKFEGMPTMSMGYLVPPGEAVVWRGPMLHGAVTQFLRDTDWGNLDYLIIDMPPGTGDIALTLSQLLPLTGAVVVCTPQDVALLDAVKAIAMFRKVNIPVLGMVENMSYFLCPDCNKRYDIFGSGGAKKKAEELKVPFLGDVPINISIRANGDAGTTVTNFQRPDVAPFLQNVVRTLIRNQAQKAASSPPMPSLPVL